LQLSFGLFTLGETKHKNKLVMTSSNINIPTTKKAKNIYIQKNRNNCICNLLNLPLDIILLNGIILLSINLLRLG